MEWGHPYDDTDCSALYMNKTSARSRQAGNRVGQDDMLPYPTLLKTAPERVQRLQGLQQIS